MMSKGSYKYFKLRQVLLMVLSLFYPQVFYSQINDTVSPLNITPAINDSDLRIKDTAIILKDSIAYRESKTDNFPGKMQKIIFDNIYLNSRASAVSFVMSERKQRSKEILFYAIFFIVFLFGLLKMFYSRYLNNLFRVFFNTSLRQTQLTDQLIQAKQPALFFNMFFILTGGFYVFLLLSNLGYIDVIYDLNVLFICIGAVLAVYIVKYFVLKFTGWISGYQNVADTYIFIVFLINKIIAIALIPIIIIMAFSDQFLVKFVLIISYFIISAILILRFLRFFGILQNKIKVQRYHFFLYIIGIEILPLLLIYKSAMILLTNNH